MYCVYILLLEHRRLYVGETKLWRLLARWNEHMDPNTPAAKWTTKYKPLQKLCTFQFNTRTESKLFENKLVEHLMKQFGLDSVRGGKYNMVTENETWWVKPSLQNIPRFTSKWFTFECMYAEFGHCVQTRCEVFQQLQ